MIVGRPDLAARADMRRQRDLVAAADRHFDPVVDHEATEDDTGRDQQLVRTATRYDYAGRLDAVANNAQRGCSLKADRVKPAV